MKLIIHTDLKNGIEIYFQYFRSTLLVSQKSLFGDIQSKFVNFKNHNPNLSACVFIEHYQFRSPIFIYDIFWGTQFLKYLVCFLKLGFIFVPSYIFIQNFLLIDFSLFFAPLYNLIFLYQIIDYLRIYRDRG